MNTDTVKELIHLLNIMKKLVTLNIEFACTINHDERPLTYEFNQSHYPHLVSCYLKFPVNISLVVCDKFHEIFYNRVALRASSSQAQFNIYNVCHVKFFQAMMNIQVIKIYSWPCFTNCELKYSYFPNAMLILGMHDIDDYTKLTNSLKRWDPKKITFSTCTCINERLVSHLRHNSPLLLEMNFETTSLCRHRLSRIANLNDHRKSCSIS